MAVAPCSQRGKFVETEDKKQQFNVYLPPELVRELKHAAIDDRSSLSRYVERIFREFLERRGKEQST